MHNKPKILFLLLSITTIVIYYQAQISKENQVVWHNLKIKQEFENIYIRKLWGDDGNGSGGGSTLEYTIETRNIIYEVVQKYKINSILDAPCGAMAWMPELLKNLSKKNTNFKYHGVDVFEKGINNSKVKYNSEYPNWKFSVLDLTQHEIPPNYDLILSRDSLQHLPLVDCVKALKHFAKAKNSRYLLIGNYMTSKKNFNTNVGGGFQINTVLPPFNLKSYVASYRERYIDDQKFQKFLVLYEMSYLRTIDYDKMMLEAQNMTSASAKK